MNSQELENVLQDNQEALFSLDQRFNEMEKREKDREGKQMSLPLPAAKLPDYSAELKEIWQTVLQILEGSTPAKQAEELAAIVDKVLKKLPEKVKTVVVHRLDAGSKDWIAGAIAVVLVVAALSGITFNLWRENEKLQANDVKFHLVRQYYPKAAYWADTAYRHRPEEMTLLAEQPESVAADSAQQKTGRNGTVPTQKASENTRKSSRHKKR